MQRTSISTLQKLPSVVLYREDIEELVGILQSQCKTITLAIPGYRFDNISELLTSAHGPLHELKIEAHDPYVTLEFLRFEAQLYISDNDVVNVGLATKIRAVLDGCRRAVQPSPFMYGSSAALVCSLGIGAVNAIMAQNVLGAGASTLGGLLSVLFARRLWTTGANRYSIIYLTLRSQRSSFFQRKKDDLALAAISALLGAVLGALGTWLLAK
jgi:hypothetical protein